MLAKHVSVLLTKQSKSLNLTTNFNITSLQISWCGIWVFNLDLISVAKRGNTMQREQGKAILNCITLQTNNKSTCKWEAYNNFVFIYLGCVLFACFIKQRQAFWFTVDQWVQSINSFEKVSLKCHCLFWFVFPVCKMLSDGFFFPEVMNISFVNSS